MVVTAVNRGTVPAGLSHTFIQQGSQQTVSAQESFVQFAYSMIRNLFPNKHRQLCYSVSSQPVHPTEGPNSKGKEKIALRLSHFYIEKDLCAMSGISW